MEWGEREEESSLVVFSCVVRILAQKKAQWLGGRAGGHDGAYHMNARLMKEQLF